MYGTVSRELIRKSTIIIVANSDLISYFGFIELA